MRPAICVVHVAATGSKMTYAREAKAKSFVVKLLRPRIDPSNALSFQEILRPQNPLNSSPPPEKISKSYFRNDLLS